MAIIAIQNKPHPPQQYMKQRRRSLLQRRSRAGMLFVAPGAAFIGLFFIVPLLMTFWISLHNWPLIGASHFIGLKNYTDLVSDTIFWSSLAFTAKYTLIITPIIFLLAFGLALLVKEPVSGVNLFRTAYFMPVVIGLNTASLIWVWMFNDQVGIFDSILMQLHIIHDPIIWLASSGSALAAIIIMVVWKTSGLTMLLLLLGMQAIPDEFYEAAKVDGAGYWTALRYITLPLLRRTFALALTLSVIGSFLAFDQFYVMTHGGPQNETATVVYWIYTNAFTYFKLGYGSALSIVLLVILIALSALQLFLLRDANDY